MYLAGVSVRRVEDITEALWGSKVSASTISELNKKAYVNIEAWRNRPLQGGKYPYVYVDGIYLKRNWGGESTKMWPFWWQLPSTRMVIVRFRCCRGHEGGQGQLGQLLPVAPWTGLEGVKLIVGDKCLGMLEAVGEVFPEAKYQRCVVHFTEIYSPLCPNPRSKMWRKC